MNAVTLSLRAAPDLAVDCSPLNPDRLAGLSLEAIAALALPMGNGSVPVGELFELDREAGEGVVIRHACDRLDRVGAGMSGGALRVVGDVGGWLAFGLTGGRVEVSGNAGAFAASGMAAGTLHVRGRVGDFLGAAQAGDKQGMLGGLVVVDGDAGDRVGDHLRRGMLLIGGDAGDYCGARMLAGTIVVRGRCGALTGFGMKRGTLLLGEHPELPATFNDCGTQELMFLRLFARHLAAVGGAAAAFAPASERVRRYVGDLGNGGQGEILIPA